jgi:hypothetical protein
MNTTRYFSRDGGPPFAVTADGDDIPDELDGCEEVSAADMDAAEQAYRRPRRVRAGRSRTGRRPRRGALRH